MPRQKFEDLDKDTQNKIKALTITRMMQHFDRNPQIKDEDLKIFFGFTRDELKSKFPSLVPQNATN